MLAKNLKNMEKYTLEEAQKMVMQMCAEANDAYAKINKEEKFFNYMGCPAFESYAVITSLYAPSELFVAKDVAAMRKLIASNLHMCKDVLDKELMAAYVVHKFAKKKWRAYKAVRHMAATVILLDDDGVNYNVVDGYPVVTIDIGDAYCICQPSKLIGIEPFAIDDDGNNAIVKCDDTTDWSPIWKEYRLNLPSNSFSAAL